MGSLSKGFIQVYTGDGKGKTTAVVGLAIRALGAGLKIAFLQFFKPDTSSEVLVLKQFEPKLFYQNFGGKKFVKGKVGESLKEDILKGWELAKNLIKEGKYDVVVLDEIFYALNWKIIELKEFLEVLKEKADKVEVVLTGRNVPQEVLEVADLVTEVKKIKHYFDKGVLARKGIEK